MDGGHVGSLRQVPVALCKLEAALAITVARSKGRLPRQVAGRVIGVLGRGVLGTHVLQGGARPRSRQGKMREQMLSEDKNGSQEGEDLRRQRRVDQPAVKPQSKPSRLAVAGRSNLVKPETLSRSKSCQVLGQSRSPSQPPSASWWSVVKDIQCSNCMAVAVSWSTHGQTWFDHGVSMHVNRPTPWVFGSFFLFRQPAFAAGGPSS